MYLSEILQATCDCYLLLKDYQLFLVTIKAGCINQSRNIWYIYLSIFTYCAFGASLNCYKCELVISARY